MLLNLSTEVRLDAETLKAANLTDRWSDEDLSALGAYVWGGYERDNQSRIKWYSRNEAGMNLAMQLQEAKSFPWANCSNVAFPLVTIGAMQFHARAYPAIISGTDVVKCRTFGEDPEGLKAARASRISEFMSWQCLEEDQAWEEQHDRGLLNLAIVGTNFIKTRRDDDLQCQVSELVLAKDLVVDYYTKSLETASRVTQKIQMSRNDIWERCETGAFRDVREESWFTSPQAPKVSSERQKQDVRQGVQPPEPDDNTPFGCLEQHVLLDLDGDGYQEPWIITIEETTQCVLRVVSGANKPDDIQRKADGSIVKIRRVCYFTKYELIPAPDGGFYGVGFGVLLGPLNESVNSAINQLFDAGTMSVAAGGFLARGAKIRGGTYTFSPFQWQRVDSSGDDLRKSLVPLPVREPSNVLFQLLGLLIDYTNRISGANDMMVGENPGQNTPAATAQAMVEQGSKIYAAIFKRIWRAMKEEFKKRYVLNGIYLPADGSGLASRSDFLGNPEEVAPAADPNISSDAQALAQAQMVKASAMQTPGYDLEAVERFLLKRMKVPDVDKLYPGLEKFPPQKSEKVQIQEMKMASDREKLQADQALEMARLSMDYQRLQADMQIAQAELQAKMIELQGDVQDRQVQQLNAYVSMLKSQADSMKARMDVLAKQLEVNAREAEARSQRLEPLFRAKELSQTDRELDIREHEAESKRIAAKKPAAAGAKK